MSTTAPAPAPTAPGGLVNAAPPGNPSVPFEYPDTSGEPTGSEAFDKMFSGEPAEKNGAPEPAKPAPTTPEPAKTEKSVTNSLDEGLPTEQKQEKPPEAPVAPQKEPKSAPELREAYKRANETLAAKEKELAELRTKLTAAPQKQELNGEAETYQKRITDLETRLKDREEALKFTDYSQSAEYKETYLAPLEQAVEKVKKNIVSFKVDQEDGTTRRATLSDLKPLLKMEPGEAWEAAEKIFGTSAPAIMSYRDQIVDLNERAQGAVEDFKTKGSERMKIREQEMAQKQQQELENHSKEFEGHITYRQTTAPKLYAHDEKDPEGNKLLDAGRRLVETAFKPNSDMNPQELLKVRAEMAVRAMGFGRAVHRANQLEAKVAELTKKLESYEKSEPTGRGDRDTGDVGIPTNDDIRSWQRDLDAIPSMRR